MPSNNSAVDRPEKHVYHDNERGFTLKPKLFMLLTILALAPNLGADAEFDTGGTEKSETKTSVVRTPEASRDGASPAHVTQILEAGDVPTAYALLKYEVRSDVRFYGGGGILTKASLGLFSRFSIGGGLNVPSLIGSGNIDLHREDVQLLVRLMAFKEDERFPAIALGWDGPAYAGGALRGLYVVASKDIKAGPGSLQLHGGLNTPVFDNFAGNRDLRGFAAATTSYQMLTVFLEADDLFEPAGVRINAGGRVFFDPISLGVEFHDLGNVRNGSQVSRLLRVAYTGLF
jgi:hypothetical protein